MGVYIKGMEMPESCQRCRFLEGGSLDGLCHAAERWLDDDDFWTWYVYPEGDADLSKPANCPLIPVPVHGDLIEYDFCLKNYELLHDDDGNPVYAVRMRDINKAPTIIPADKEGEG